MEHLTALLLFFVLEATTGEIRLSLDSNQGGRTWIVWNQNKETTAVRKRQKVTLRNSKCASSKDNLTANILCSTAQHRTDQTFHLKFRKHSPDTRYPMKGIIRGLTITITVDVEGIQTTAKVPGGIYTDLQRAGILSNNLFYRFNDMEYRWVAKDNWFYQTTFDVPPFVLNKSAVNLVFHGIDTVGEVYLNGNFLADVDNMFVRYVLPIKGVIKEKNNTLQVQLKSPISEANRLSKDQNRTYTVPPQCTPSQYNGECHVNFLRKMQASFSWDWGPAFPSVGIWKSVEIEAFDLGVIRDVMATAFRMNSSTWQINTTAYIEYADDAKRTDVSGLLKLEDIARNEVMVSAVMGELQKDASSYVRNGYTSQLTFYVDQSATKTWWPSGFGEQPLYDLTVSLETIDHSEISSKTIKIGFRTVELVQEELLPGKRGLTFYFKVNGVPIFAKGSNWIPGHILPELSYDESMLRHALQSTKDANMNMLRVWGGGVYESDAFYRIADELGILIWQDMMFACSMYPTDEKFLESVKMEAEQQIRRLHYHPSIALWAGNNENEVALRQNWYRTYGNFTLYKSDYIKLYVDTLQPLVEELDKSRHYAVSSPSNGIESAKEDHVAKDPQSPLFGDVHHYEYIQDGWNSYIYPDTRFASEYGFQSMPSFKTMSEVTLPADRNLHSEFTAKRQHHIVGNFAMLSLIQRNLPHFETDSSVESYKTFIYYSQIYQAVTIKVETEKYRRDRSKLTTDNKGHTMGAMYWQLNDVWQAPTWSSIEFGGKWKMLHYYAKKFFSPVLVSPERTQKDIINVFLISDLLEDVPDVELKVSVYNWEDFTPRKTHSYRVLLKKASSERHKVYQMSTLLEEAKCQPAECFIYFTLEGPNIFSDNVIYPAKFHAVSLLKKPKFTVTVTKGNTPSEAVIKITTDRIAVFVWLETDELGEFSDNGFLLLQREITLGFKGRNNKQVDVNKLKSTLTIQSLESTDASLLRRQLSIAKTYTQGLTNLAVHGIKQVFN